MHERIKKCMNFILINDPFFASLLITMNVSESPFCDKMSTNCIDMILYSNDFIDNITDTMCLIVLYHELWHKAYMHNIDMKKVEYPGIMNVAADFVINIRLLRYFRTDYMFSNVANKIDLVYIDLDDLINKFKPDTDERRYIYYDEYFDGMSVYEVYEILMDKLDPKDLGQTFLIADIILQDDDKVSMIESEIISAIECSKLSGFGSSDIINDLEAKFAPQVDWKTIVQNWLTRFFEDDISNHSPHYLSESLGYFIPGVIKHLSGSVGFAVDMSGSMSMEDRNICASEFYSIYQQLELERLELICFADKVTGRQTFLRGEKFKPEFVGTGGTLLQPVFKESEKLDLDVLIVVTDGFISDWYPHLNIPILFLSTSETSSHFPKYGQKVIWDKSKI